MLEKQTYDESDSVINRNFFFFFGRPENDENSGSEAKKRAKLVKV